MMSTEDYLISFLLQLREQGLINAHGFDYEAEAASYEECHPAPVDVRGLIGRLYVQAGRLIEPLLSMGAEDARLVPEVSEIYTTIRVLERYYL